MDAVGSKLSEHRNTTRLFTWRYTLRQWKVPYKWWIFHCQGWLPGRAQSQLVFWMLLFPLQILTPTWPRPTKKGQFLPTHSTSTEPFPCLSLSMATVVREAGERLCYFHIQRWAAISFDDNCIPFTSKPINHNKPGFFKSKLDPIKSQSAGDIYIYI